jgi:hypothetical protein
MDLQALQKEFNSKRDRLIALLTSVSEGVLRTKYPDAKNVSEHLCHIADILGGNATLEEKRRGGATIRSVFHKEGFQDWPGPKLYKMWHQDTEELYNLSTIYSESKYKGVVTEQDSGADGV